MVEPPLSSSLSHSASQPLCISALSRGHGPRRCTVHISPSPPQPESPSSCRSPAETQTHSLAVAPPLTASPLEPFPSHTQPLGPSLNAALRSLSLTVSFSPSHAALPSLTQPAAPLSRLSVFDGKLCGFPSPHTAALSESHCTASLSLLDTDHGVDTYFGLCTYPGCGLRHQIDFKHGSTPNHQFRIHWI